MAEEKQSNLTEWVIEVDRDVYDEVVKLCGEMGTTIEKVTEEFIRFCADPVNLPAVERMIANCKVSVG